MGKEDVDIVDPFTEGLREKIAILSCTHPLFAVFKCGKGWKATYRDGKKGRLNWEGDSAAEGLDMVERWKGIV